MIDFKFLAIASIIYALSVDNDHDFSLGASEKNTAEDKEESYLLMQEELKHPSIAGFLHGDSLKEVMQHELFCSKCVKKVVANRFSGFMDKDLTIIFEPTEYFRNEYSFTRYSGYKEIDNPDGQPIKKEDYIWGIENEDVFRNDKILKAYTKKYSDIYSRNYILVGEKYVYFFFSEMW